MPKLPPQNTETYIGDDCYVSLDGWCIRLRAPRESGDHIVDHIVVLEPEVYESLRKWVHSYPQLARLMREHVE